MRRWFELGELEDTTYAAHSGDIQFLQLPQKAEFIKWANSMVGVIARLTTGTGDSGLCEGVGSPHVIQHVANVNLLSAYGELRGLVMFNGIPPVFEPLTRQYFEKPGINDGPAEGQTKEAPRKRNTQLGNVAAPAVFDAIKVLQNFAAQLLKSRNLELQRIGNIINSQLAMAFAGTKDIVAVFTFLQPFLDEANVILNG